MILNGKELRDKILKDLKKQVDKMENKPTLAVILVGDNPASEIYVNNKSKKAQEIGIKSLVIKYPSSIEEKVILDKIEELNKNNEITAILVQLPLPEHISKTNIINAIDPKKDVDGFTPLRISLHS